MRRLIALLLVLLPLPVVAQEVRVDLTTASDGTRTLSHEVIVPATPEAVWQAVGTVEGWRTWAVPLARASAGGERFETSYDPGAAPGAADTIEQAWISREPPRRASFRTTRTPAGFPHAEAYMRVISHFELEPAGVGATRVRLVGSGYAAGPDGDMLIGFFREGNRTSLQQLHARFVSGPIDWPARLARPAAK